MGMIRNYYEKTVLFFSISILNTRFKGHFKYHRHKYLVINHDSYVTTDLLGPMAKITCSYVTTARAAPTASVAADDAHCGLELEVRSALNQ